MQIRCELELRLLARIYSARRLSQTAEIITRDVLGGCEAREHVALAHRCARKNADRLEQVGELIPGRIAAPDHGRFFTEQSPGKSRRVGEADPRCPVVPIRRRKRYRARAERKRR